MLTPHKIRTRATARVDELVLFIQTTEGEMTNTKLVDSNEICNFTVDDFFI